MSMTEKRKTMTEKGMLVTLSDGTELYAVSAKWNPLRQTQRRIIDGRDNINLAHKAIIERYPTFTTGASRVRRVTSPTSHNYRTLYYGKTLLSLMETTLQYSHDEAIEELNNIMGEELRKDACNGGHVKYFTAKSAEEAAGGKDRAYDFWKNIVNIANRGGMILTHNNVNDSYTDTLRAVATLSTTTHSEGAYNSRANAVVIHKDGLMELWNDNQKEWDRAKNQANFHSEGNRSIGSIVSRFDTASRATKEAKELLSNIEKYSDVCFKHPEGLTGVIDATIQSTFRGWDKLLLEGKIKGDSVGFSAQADNFNRLRQALDFSTWDLYGNHEEIPTKESLSENYLIEYGKALGYLVAIDDDAFVDVLMNSRNRYRFGGNNAWMRVMEHHVATLELDVDCEKYWRETWPMSYQMVIKGRDVGDRVHALDENGNYIRDENNNYVRETPIPDRECVMAEAETLKKMWIDFYGDKKHYEQYVDRAYEARDTLEKKAREIKFNITAIFKEKGLITTDEGNEA